MSLYSERRLRSVFESLFMGLVSRLSEVGICDWDKFLSYQQSHWDGTYSGMISIEKQK